MAHSELANKLDSRLKALESARLTWDATAQEIAEFIFPDKADFTVQWGEGQQRNMVLFDATAPVAAGLLAAALQSLLTSPGDTWLRMRPVSPQVNDDSEAKLWADGVVERVLATLYSDGVGFVTAEHEMYLDVVTFGVACMNSEDDPATRVRVRAYPIRDIFYAENSRGAPDTVYRRQKMTARQIEQDWPGKCSESVKAALESSPEQMFDVVHAVYPRVDAPKGIPAERLTNRDMPFASVWFERAGAHLLSESGYHEQPYHVMRWGKAAGEIMGRGPGLTALPFIRALNAMVYTAMLASEKIANPPTMLPDDGLVGTVDTGPGGIVYYRVGSGDDIKQFPVEADLSGALALIERNTEAVKNTFLYYQMQPAVGGPQKTIPQVLLEQEEKMRALGPAMGRMQTEYLTPFINRVFNILLRAGDIPPPPESIQGEEVMFEYSSPVSRSQKLNQARAFGQAVEYVAPVMQVDPSVRFNFDSHKIVRDSQTIFGYPADYLRPEADVQASIKAEQDAIAQAQEAQTVTDGVKTASEAAKAGLIGGENAEG
jgi:hypothetical protein